MKARDGEWPPLFFSTNGSNGTTGRAPVLVHSHTDTRKAVVCHCWWCEVSRPGSGAAAGSQAGMGAAKPGAQTGDPRGIGACKGR